jgi:ferredoxin--NADP+ reductase
VRAQLLYYPTVTREAFEHQGRLTDLLRSGRLAADLGLPPLDPALDRAMICGSTSMLTDLSALLDGWGFGISPGIGEQGDYVIERAFVAR